MLNITLSKDLGNAEDLSKLKQEIDSNFDIIEQRENKEILRHLNEDIDELPLTQLQSRQKTTCDVSLQAALFFDKMISIIVADNSK